MAGRSISPRQERSLNFFGFSPGELLLIMMLAMIVLGPEKLPEVAGSIGKWVAEFRRATQELTQQFGDENPFTEIQRALNLTNEPIVLGQMPTQAVAEDAPVQAAAPGYAPTVGYEPAVVTSDFFSRPPLHPPIADDWAHGSVPEEWASRLNGHAVFAAGPVADDWAHGVPIPSDPLLESILAAQAEVEHAAPDHPLETMGVESEPIVVGARDERSVSGGGQRT